MRNLVYSVVSVPVMAADESFSMDSVSVPDFCWREKTSTAWLFFFARLTISKSKIWRGGDASVPRNLLRQQGSRSMLLTRDLFGLLSVYLQNTGVVSIRTRLFPAICVVCIVSLPGYSQGLTSDQPSWLSHWAVFVTLHTRVERSRCWHVKWDGLQRMETQVSVVAPVLCRSSCIAFSSTADKAPKCVGWFCFRFVANGNYYVCKVGHPATDYIAQSRKLRIPAHIRW